MNAICSFGFGPLLEEFPREEVDRSPNVIFGMWSDFSLAYFNVSWSLFAKANGGVSRLVSSDYLGTSLLDVCGEALRPFYQAWFAASLALGKDNLTPSQREYECSSRELYRRFLMTLYPLGKGEGLLAVNTLIVEAPHGDRKGKAHAPDRAVYLSADGVIHQCSHCRKVERIADESRWDWVPDWVESPPPETSHGICPMCLNYYY
jgi:hypothetical protein